MLRQAQHDVLLTSQTASLVNLQPDMALSDLMRDVKATSSRFINEQRWTAGRFAWQSAFGPFSYAASQLDAVIGYIQPQEQHHAKSSFRQE